jgi:DNA-binding transcriptional LysR family regulator
MDKHTEMSVFTEVAKLGSFSAAARRLQLSPSAVSKLITRMEQRLDARLFNRSTRKLSLTEGGQKFYARCEEILAEVEAAEELLLGYQREPRGILTVTCSPGFAEYQLLPLIPQFLCEHPHVELNLQITGDTVDLITQGIDVAIRLGTLQDSSLVARELGQSRRIVCASPTYLSRYKSPETPTDLTDHNCLIVSTGDRFDHWKFSSANQEQVVAVTGSFVCNTVNALLELALQGIGIVNLAEYIAAPELRSGRLVPLLQGYQKEVQFIHAVYPHRKHLPRKVRAFVDFLRSHYSPQASWEE